MAQAIQIIAELIAIIFAPIGCWLAYKNIPKDRIKEIKKEINFAKEVVSFLFVLIALVVLFMLEAISTDPITRFAIAKMCVFSSLAILWAFLHVFIFLVNMGKRHTAILLQHANVTQAYAEILTRHVNITEKIADRIN